MEPKQMKQQIGDHTWKVQVAYHKCPECGYIVENRTDYQDHLGIKKKDIVCPKCHTHYFVYKKGSKALGPLIEPNHPGPK